MKTSRIQEESEFIYLIWTLCRRFEGLKSEVETIRK